jgi:enoyl-CoA hydratase
MINLLIDNTIATITLNRPKKLNALSPEMLMQMDNALNEIDNNSQIRVVLLRGAGEKAFSVGADITAWTKLSPIDMWQRWIRDGHRIFDRLARLRQPTISVLQGYTLGGGLELALATDIRLAGDQIELGQPEVKLATVPGWGGTQRLPDLIGVGRAKQMIFSGERIPADVAYQWGLVNEIHPIATLMPRATELAQQISENAPLAVQFAKQLIDANHAIATGMILEALAGALSATTEDAEEGKRAFQERRPAQFKGK